MIKSTEEKKPFIVQRVIGKLAWKKSSHANNEKKFKRREWKKKKKKCVEPGVEKERKKEPCFIGFSREVIQQERSRLDRHGRLKREK